MNKFGNFVAVVIGAAAATILGTKLGKKVMDKIEDKKSET